MNPSRHIFILLVPINQLSTLLFLVSADVLLFRLWSEHLVNQLAPQVKQARSNYRPIICPQRGSFDGRRTSLGVPVLFSFDSANQFSFLAT